MLKSSINGFVLIVWLVTISPTLAVEVVDSKEITPAYATWPKPDLTVRTKCKPLELAVGFDCGDNQCATKVVLCKEMDESVSSLMNGRQWGQRYNYKLKLEKKDLTKYLKITTDVTSNDKMMKLQGQNFKLQIVDSNSCYLYEYKICPIQSLLTMISCIDGSACTEPTIICCKLNLTRP